jgi:hypothetical protein
MTDRTNNNIDDRITWSVDEDAEPVDLDRVLARFLLSFVRQAGEGQDDEQQHNEVTKQ